MEAPTKATAFDMLKVVTKKRNWYNNKISKQTAKGIKNRLEQGTLSHELAVEALNYAGWTVAEPETWAKNSTSTLTQ
jgi:hypothetical protein